MDKLAYSRILGPSFINFGMIIALLNTNNFYMEMIFSAIAIGCLTLINVEIYREIKKQKTK